MINNKFFISFSMFVLISGITYTLYLKDKFASNTDAKPANSLYQIKQFDLNSEKLGLSQEQLKQHKELYEGYVRKRNEIEQSLKTVDKSNQSRTYSPFRELKVEETYAVNGVLLHELYFENMTSERTTMRTQMKQLIKENFGTLENFKEDFFASAQCSRGWVVTAYGLDDGRIHNYVLEAHNQNVPVLAIPLLVLDVYEHAYMIDFGIKRNPYIDLFWDHIDWDVVEQRIDKWVNKIITQ